MRRRKLIPTVKKKFSLFRETLSVTVSKPRVAFKPENVSIISINSLYQNIIIYIGEVYTHIETFSSLIFFIFFGERNEKKRRKKILNSEKSF